MRAKASVAKCGGFIPRSRKFIGKELLERLLLFVRYRPEFARFGTVFLLSYVFLLRLPSEALPTVCALSGRQPVAQSVLRLEGDELVMCLQKRKNRRLGSTLRRRCWCRTSAITCPVHELAKMVDWSSDRPLFEGMSSGEALRGLRRILQEMAEPEAAHYKTHDLRRGHAEDLRASGATLREILLAGDWRSPAFLKYLNLEKLESEAVVQAHWDESSSDEVSD